jgi:hypothetical protein
MKQKILAGCAALRKTFLFAIIQVILCRHKTGLTSVLVHGWKPDYAIFTEQCPSILTG